VTLSRAAISPNWYRRKWPVYFPAILKMQSAQEELTHVEVGPGQTLRAFARAPFVLPKKPLAMQAYIS
jgi:hypothetical protein